MGKQLSDSTRARIVQLRDEGFSVVAIADRTALAEKTIRQVLNKADQTPDTRPVRKSYSAQKRRASWLKIQGWRLMDIAEATGLEPGEIEKNWKAWAVKYGIPIPQPLPVEPPPSHGEVVTYKLVDGELVKMGPVVKAPLVDDYPVSIDYRDPLEKFKMEDESYE